METLQQFPHLFFLEGRKGGCGDNLIGSRQKFLFLAIEGGKGCQFKDAVEFFIIAVIGIETPDPRLRTWRQS